MQSLNSLYFPETILPRHLRNCLLLFPDSLHLLQPVETASESEESPADDIFMEQQICQVHTPSILGKERDRFLGLIEEIKNSKDGFAEQMSALTLAHLSKEQGSGEHNHQAILTSLQGKHVSTTAVNDLETKKAALWQARLVLVLAEILDKEEAELANTLSDIDDTEMALFKELRGEPGEVSEEQDPFAELMRIKANLSQPRPGTVKRRLQAWKTLYASGTLPEEYWLWTSTQEEAAELLIDTYETVAGRNSVPLLLLDIPEHIYMRDGDALESIRNFQKRAREIRTEIIEKLSAIVAKKHLNVVDPVALLPDAGTLARDWNDLVEYHFPQERFGRKKLDFQFLANVSLNQLIQGKDSPQEQDALCHGIVAIRKE